MRKLIPHISLIGGGILFLLFGILTNSGSIGKIIGKFAAVTTDPLIFLPAIIAGFLFIEYKKFIILVIYLAFIFTLIIEYQVSEWRESLGIYDSNFHIMIYRFTSFLFVAHTANLLRFLFNIKR